MNSQLPAIAACTLALASCDSPNRQSVEVKTPEEVEARKKLAPEHADSSFKDQMTEKVFQDYLRIRTALVAGDAGEASAAADDMAESFGAERAQLKQLARDLAESSDIEAQRRTFAALSDGFRALIEEGLSEGTVHVMRCPMAFDGNGAEWLSDSKEIRNPYFGGKMLTCGEIRETLRPSKSPEKPEVPRADAGQAQVPEGYQVELVVRDLTYPTSVAFDDAGSMYIAEAGYSYGDPNPTPRILRIDGGGDPRIHVSDGLAGPVNDLLWHAGRLYVSHRGKISVVESGSVVDLVTGLPSHGDHQNNQLTAGPDGMIYFGQGTYTNSGVVGPDNAHMGWLKDHPEAHDVPARDLEVTRAVFKSPNPLRAGEGTAETRPFHPFNEPAADEPIEGETKANGTIMRMNPDGSGLEVYASGLRNPYGLLWLPDGRLVATENGMDDRGSRPVANDQEDLYHIKQGAWYGWPDFGSGIPITDPRFKPEGKPAPRFILENHPPVERPLMTFPEHSSATKIAWSSDETFGRPDQLFVAFFGHMTPMTGQTQQHGGHQVAAVNLANNQIETFFTARAPDQRGSAASQGGKSATAGPRRLIDVVFGPDGALFIVDFGTLEIKKGKAVPVRETGLIWKVSRSVSSAPDTAPPPSGDDRR